MPRPPRAAFAPYSPFVHVLGASEAMLGYVLSSRLALLDVSRLQAASALGLSNTRFATLLRQPSSRPTELIRLAVWIDEQAAKQRDGATGSSRSVEAFAENRFPTLLRQGPHLSAGWLRELSRTPVRSAADASVRGALLVSTLLREPNVQLRERRFEELDEISADVVQGLVALMTGPGSSPVGASNLLGQLMVLAPTPVCALLAEQMLSSPLGWSLLRALRQALRILREPWPPLVPSIADYTTISEGLWAFLHPLLDTTWTMDTYPGRSLLVSAAREYAAHVGHPSKQRRKIIEWAVNRLHEAERPRRERLQAAWLVSDLPHVYFRKAASFPAGNEFRNKHAYFFAERVNEDLKGPQFKDPAFRYASQVCDWMLGEKRHVDAPTGNEDHDLIEHEMAGWRPEGSVEVAIVRAALNEILGPHKTPPGAQPAVLGVPAHSHSATWQLVETALLTIDAVKRRNCLEALVAGGTFPAVVPVLHAVAVDRNSPDWLAEVATFALANGRDPSAYVPLLDLAAETLPSGSANDPQVRQTALWGLAETRPDADPVSIASGQAEARHLAVFTSGIGLTGSSGEIDPASDLFRDANDRKKNAPILRAATYGIAVSREERRVKLLEELGGVAVDPAVRAIAAWGIRLARSTEPTSSRQPQMCREFVGATDDPGDGRYAASVGIARSDDIW